MLSIQDKINKIMWNQRYINIPRDIPSPNGIRTLILKDPTVHDHNFYLYTKSIEENAAKECGVPFEKEVFDEARKAGYWTETDQLVFDEIDKNIDLLEENLKDQKILSKKKVLLKQISSLKEQKSNISKKREELKMKSAEYLAHETAIFSLILRLIFTIDGEKLWSSEQEFIRCKEDYLSFVIHLINEYLSENLFPTKELREIGRSAEWRLIWNLQKNDLCGLFNKPISDLNSNQKLLIYWSRVYDSAFDDMECPEMDVINDDDRFDEWLSDKQNKAGNKSKRYKKDILDNHYERMVVLQGEYSEVCTCGAKKIKTKGLGEHQPHNADCQYGLYREYTEEERNEIAQQFYSKNSPQIRSILNNQQNRIEQSGLIEETKLRDKKTNMILGVPTKIVK